MKKTNQVVREKGEEILQKQNVVGLGVGKKNGVGKESVVVMVREKKTPEELNKKDLIPKRISGQITDVIEVGDITADSLPRKNKERPVYGGLSCIWEKGTACTLGAIVYKGDQAYALMNTHCVNPHWKGAKAGDEVRQPSPNDRGRNKDRIGVSTKDFSEIKFNGAINTFDAGLCKLDKDIEAIELKQEELGEITIWPRHAEKGETVKKSGRTTGLTQTTVILTNATVNVNYDGNIARFYGQTIVENNGRHFGAGGDSSSLVVDERNNPVGLYFAGSPTIGIYSPIKPILEYFNIRFTEEEIQKPQYKFTRTLHKGDYGDEVVELQKRLKEEGFFHYHTATGYFGTITEQAVKDYQCAKGIICSGNRFITGWGQVGPKTREELNKIWYT